jgi:flagellar basal-body rod protein FlgC
MDFFTAMNVSSAGLSAQRTRINIASSNLANIETTRTPEGGPYRRRQVMLAAVPFEQTFAQLHGADMGAKSGQVHSVEVTSIEADQSEPRLVYNPEHPDARQDGYVAMPNINPVSEMVDLLTTTRSYEANVSALKATKAMALEALKIGGGA